MIIFTNTRDVSILSIALAFIFTMAGWLYAQHEERQLKAEAVRTYHEVRELESRADLYEPEAKSAACVVSSVIAYAEVNP